MAIGEHQVFALALDDFGVAGSSRWRGKSIGRCRRRGCRHCRASAPPIVPGIPTSGSRPAKTLADHSRNHVPEPAPPPAVTVCPLHADLVERRGGEPHDDPVDAVVAHQQIRAAAEHADRHARRRGSAARAPPAPRPCAARRKTPPGPPRWNHVCGASGSASRTIFSKPLNKGLTDFPNVASSHRNQHVAGAKVARHARDDPVQCRALRARRRRVPTGRQPNPRPSLRPVERSARGRGRSRPRQSCPHCEDSRPVRPVRRPSARPDAAGKCTTARRPGYIARTVASVARISVG